MKYMMKVPTGRLIGVYGAHQKAHEAAIATIRPLWKKYDDHILVLADKPSAKYESKEYDPNPSSGMAVMMALTFDVSVCKGPPENNCRVDVVLEAWLKNKAEGVAPNSWSEIGFEIGKSWLEARQRTHGFKIIETQLCEYSVLEFMRKGQKLRVGTIDFFGMIEITDREKFSLAMVNGIGHSKAWGCGLVLCNQI